MKTILLYTFALLLFAGCDKKISGDNDRIYMQSFIYEYVDNELSVYPYHNEHSVAERNFLFCRIHENNNSAVRYVAPELGWPGYDPKRFLEIATRNGDRSYNRYETFEQFSGRICCADNFKSMHVKCLNKAWDNVHPAGSSLDNIVTIEYSSIADYIRQGYPEDFNWKKGYDRKVLTDLAENDLSMIGTSIDLYFDSTPPAGSYDMEVTLVTTDGVEKTAACTLVIE